MCTCVLVRIDICVYVHEYYVYINTCMWVCVCIYMCMQRCIGPAHVKTFKCADYLYTNIYIYIYIYIYTCM